MSLGLPEKGREYVVIDVMLWSLDGLCLLLTRIPAGTKGKEHRKHLMHEWRLIPSNFLLEGR